jgi:hypothetical protein
MSSGIHRKLDESGIAREIQYGRPYVRYTRDDVRPVQDAYRGLPAAARGTMTRWAGQSDGLLIVGHAPPGLGLQDPYPEMRPDDPIRTHKAVHVHPEARPRETPVNPATGNPLRAQHVHSAEGMRHHVDKSKGLTDAHGGINREDVHEHQYEAKYLFPPRPKIKKTRRWVDDDGVAQARDYKVKDKSVNLAKRLDVHPDAVQLIEDAERVFFVIEGCLKADAILSQGEAVFSVPSVTLWDAPELEDFARMYLLGKFVVIVPDADWKENDAVVTQALLCRTFLRRLGIEAVVAAPPIESGHKGVDDFLAAGGTVSDLLVLGREKPESLVAWPRETRRVTEQVLIGHLPEFVKGYLLLTDNNGRRLLRLDRIKRIVRTLDGLAEHVGEDGTYSGTLARLARVIGLHPKQVERAIRDLASIAHWGTRDWNVDEERWERDGLEHPQPVGTAVEILEGGLETGPGRWKSNIYYEWREDWEARPTIRLHPELRYPETKRIRLGDHPQVPRPRLCEDIERQVGWLKERVRDSDQQAEMRARGLLEGTAPGRKQKADRRRQRQHSPSL